MKSNLVHKLHRLATYGVMPLSEFKELITEEEYRACETRRQPHPWYSLTSEVFIKFLNRVSQKS